MTDGGGVRKRADRSELSKILVPLIWGGIALVALFALLPQVASILDRSNGLKSLKLGATGLEATFADADKKLAPPDPHIRDILIKLTPDQTEYLLTHNDSYRPVCDIDGIKPSKEASTTAQKAKVYRSLADMKLADLKPDPTAVPPSDSCLPGHVLEASLTDEGKSVKSYLVGLVKTLKLSQ